MLTSMPLDQFAPNAQKARNLLNATGIPFQVCEQPFVLPRPIMKDLGITYRRIPVNSIGKDVYCDNRIFLEAVQSIFPDRALPRTPADAAYEQFGYRSFWVALPIVNASLITPALAKDREKLFAVFSREDFATLKPNGLAEMKCLLDVVENEFLSHGKPWIAGDRCGVADIHAIWIIKWAFETLEIGKEPGFSREDFPRVYRWIEGLPKHIPETEPEKMDAETAKSKVLAAGYAAKEIGVDPIDPTGLKAGTEVAVGTNDEYVMKIAPNFAEPSLTDISLQCET